MKNEKWFNLGIPEVEKILKTNAASGLTRKAARSRVNRSAGSLYRIISKSPLKLLLEILSDFALILLLLAAVISLFFEETQRGITILTLSGAQILILWLMYYRSQRTMESLSSFFYPTARVIRGGKLFHVDFRSVVVGDVMLIEEGDVICGDARLVTSDGLRVKMRVDRDNYKVLEKMAEGHVNPREYRASEMVNMVHAGSVVEKGSGRAIVTAVGMYTYLGTMTGGIEITIPEGVSKIIKKIQKLCGKINLITLLAVLPFCIISLLLGHINGGTVVLSEAFLTAVSLAVTTVSQMTCILLKLFYTKKIREMVAPPDSAIIRSVEAFDKLASADYLFMLDGCALTDGILHFYAGACGDGEIRNYESPGPTTRYFSELVALYYSAASRALTTGISDAGNYFAAIKEFIRKIGVDEGALKIRCSILSYASGNLRDSSELMYFSDQGERRLLKISCSATAISKCDSILIGGKRQKLSAEGMAKLEEMRTRYASKSCAPMIFSLSSDVNDTDTCFIGMLSFAEGVDPQWQRKLSYIEKMGCRVILFSGRMSQSAPHIPKEIAAHGGASKQDFIKNNLPLTYSFGKIRIYSDFSQEDIITLLNYAHAHGKNVVTVGFDEESLAIAEHSEAFVTCAPVHTRTAGYLDEEIQTLEVVGQQYSTSCKQTVRENADFLIPRPYMGKGGLSSLAAIFLQIKRIHRNISDFLQYLIGTQMIRLLVTALPMLFGYTVLNGIHILFCSCVLDIFAFLIITRNNDPVKTLKTEETGLKGLKEGKAQDRAILKRKEFFLDIQALLMASLLSSLATVFLPLILDFSGIMGQYFYKTEFCFMSLILLHVCALFVLRFDSLQAARKLYRSLLFVSELMLVTIFLFLCLTWESFGGLFYMDKHPLPYFILSFAPVVIFFCVIAGFKKFSKRNKSDNPNKKTNKK